MKSQRGFLLPLAIALLVICASLSVVLLRLTGSDSQATALAVQYARALNAAQAGLDWGRYQALHENSCLDQRSFDLDAVGMSGFRVEVRCQRLLHRLGKKNELESFTLTSMASAGVYGSPSFVFHQLSRNFVVE